MTVAPSSPPGPGVTTVYPWAEWLDGREWTLVRGRDFWDTAEMFTRRIRGAANGRSIKVRIRSLHEGRILTVQAVDR